ncbi:glutamate--cysteine ligase [Enterovibrio sp. ZSDZ35]|uniref:Glutamate--cysteine ligase n=1 Tax=Enterovibrio qingdaonensis TaxID=2899818 RepID=A0ABT5QH83_9GAMM|nr:glutamate--cysteine ligase [Enterovibrio sp. ZSDZ35]MDD1780350.1 glutamate--cysteine ligase [Enterovibrio sp. ZSDZ35]
MKKISMSTFAGTLGGIRRGIEKETVRTTPKGAISPLSHPKSLGSALMHPFITTDFAEAQLELITPAYTDKKAVFSHLGALHHFVANNLPSNEMLWPASLPPVLPDEAAIVIAHYGSSNAAEMKMRYRQGLANRYGKRMQTISGIHYNFSLPESFWVELHQQENSELPLADFISKRYFHLIRNALRHGWIVAYLFGASPALDKSYLEGREHDLLPMGDETFYLPWATSLRLSSIGYTNSEQSQYPISYNDKNTYLKGVSALLSKPSEKYLSIDEGQQLNKAILQLEAELYGAIRPKVVAKDMRPLEALCRKGVEYVELRTVDNNPYLPLGINETQSHFLDLFLTYCALSPSPELTVDEQAVIKTRMESVATEGRKPNLMLPTLDGERALTEMGAELLADMTDVAAMFDHAFETHEYSQSLMLETQKLADQSLTPSAQMLQDMQQDGIGYTTLVSKISQAHMKYHRANEIAPDFQAELSALVTTSLNEQKTLEAEQHLPFEDFLTQKNAMTCDC